MRYHVSVYHKLVHILYTSASKQVLICFAEIEIENPKIVIIIFYGFSHFFPFVNWNEEIKVEYNEEMLLNEIIECRLFHYSWFSKEKKIGER